ncbi:aromatic-ring-hydroxylating dioxygenase subunit beta [Halioxenophilus sp. WMMB6]|uniref:aromatic-ring-hydroxylating dioxygenase subunit beta n=1 Tax=Halioxenophilus sp. WMMB6 TaxID=3073815 RepID=UPI00295E8021|nr:aromatic-ring-hydroxylating dioxygenase subunit beta [Halioxenophilus sp. WMMB6]
MSAMANKSFDLELINRVSQFYYKEARLLDERCFQQWLGLVDNEIEYSMPARFVPQANPELQDTEAFLGTDQELERAKGGQGSPLRFDGHLATFVRTYRPFKTTAWAESPAPRTRRFISNIEVEPLEDNSYRVYSNFQMFYSHSGTDNHTYTGGRRDLLKEVDGEFRIFKREVITDWDVITVPSLALIF